MVFAHKTGCQDVTFTPFGVQIPPWMPIKAGMPNRCCQSVRKRGQSDPQECPSDTPRAPFGHPDLKKNAPSGHRMCKGRPRGRRGVPPQCQSGQKSRSIDRMDQHLQWKMSIRLAVLCTSPFCSACKTQRKRKVACWPRRSGRSPIGYIYIYRERERERERNKNSRSTAPVDLMLIL